MKIPSAIRFFLALTGSSLFAVSSASAQLYWDSNGTTAGAGDTPTGIWGTDNFWNTDSTGGAGTFSTTTLSTSDLFFSAGTDAVNPYTIGLGAGTRNARLVTFEDGTVTLNDGTLSLGNLGGITVTANTVTGSIISTNLTLSGSQTFNVAAGRTLTLNTGTFTRNAGATLNVSSTGTVNTTMTGLASGSLVNGIIGPWATFGSGASTRYATIDGSNNIVGYTGGTAAATAAAVTNTGGTFNYDVAAVGTLGAGANINTLRYTGGAGAIAGALTTNGIMNVGGTALAFSGAITSGTGEMVINNANTAGTITFNGAVNNNGNMLTVDGNTNNGLLGTVIFGATATLSGTGGLTKNGSGMLNFRAMTTAPSYSGPTVINGGILLYNGGNNIGTGTGNITLNDGVLMTYFGGSLTRAQGSGTSQIQILGGTSGFGSQGNSGSTFNIGATAQWGSATFNPSVFVLQTTGTNPNGQLTFSSGIDLNGGQRTISVSGIDLTGTSNITGVISNSTGTGSLIKIGSGPLTLSNTNTYNGSTTISQGIIIANTTASLGNSSATNTLIFNGGTLRATGTITSAATRSVTMTQNGIIDNNGQAISIAGNIGGAGGLTKNGLGTLTLSGTNNFGGVTTVNNGTLQLANEVSLASNTAANLNVKSNATLALNVGGAGQFTASTINTLLTNISVANTAAQGLQGGAFLGFDTTGGTFTQGNLIADSTGTFGGLIGLTKLGAGTLILDQANTYTGRTTITTGTLQLGSGTAAGSLSASSPINIGTGASFVVNQTDTVTQGTEFGFVGGLGGFTQAGSGTTILNQANTFSGTTTVSGGNLTLSNALALRNSALVTTGAGTVTLGAGVTAPTFGGLSGASGDLASVITNYNSVTNITLNPATGVTNTYGGVIGAGSGVSLTKTGAGTQTLTGANLYTGATTINQGTLNLGGATANGSLASTVLNLSGGTLAYTRTGTNTQSFTTTNITGGANAVTTSAATQTVALNNIVRSTGGTANFSGGGAISTTNTLSNSILGGWATHNNENWATKTGANITGLGVYVLANATAATNENTNMDAATVTIGGVINTNSIRFSGASVKTLTLAAGDNIIQSGGILVRSDVGNNLSTITGGNLAGSSGGDLIIHQHNTSNSLTIASLLKNNTSATALTKSGAGNLNLTNNSNSYSGGTFLNAGTLTYTNDGQLGLAGSRNITFGGTATLTGYDGSSLGSLTVNPGAVGTVSTNTISFSSTTGSGTIRGTGGQNDTLALGNAGTFTGDVALAYNANNNSGANVPHISFSNLNDAVGSSIQIYRQGGGTDSGQVGQIGLAGNTGSLTFNNRQIQLLPRTGGTGLSMATNYLLNNNGSVANNWVINTDLLNLYDRDSTLGLGGANTGDNAFNGVIGNSAFAGAYTSGTGVLSIIKTEAGRWILGNTANTYTGVTTVSAGTLEIKSLANGGAASSIGASSNAAGNLILNGGTLRYTGDAASTDRRFTLSANSSIDASGTGAINFTNTASPSYGTVDATRTLTLTGTNTGNNTLAANLANNGTGAVTISKNGIGTWVLSGANVNTGATNISGGGKLILDYSTSDTNKIAGVLTLQNGGGDITLRGGSHLEAVTSLTMFTGGGHTSITRDGGSAKIALGAITRSQNGYVTISLAEDNLATTSSAVVNGILSGGITVGSNWAKVSSGNIVALTAGDYTALPTGSTTSTVNYQLTGSQTRAAGAALNSLRIAGDGADQVLTITSGNLNPSLLSDAAATPGRYVGNSATGGILYAGGGNNNYTITGPGSISAQNSGQELIINTFQGTLNLDMIVATGSNGMVKTGAGTLVLSKAGTYTGTTHINQGTLRLTNASGAGTTGGITVHNGGALELANGINVVTKALTITGAGVSNGGALRNVASNTSSYAGAITLGAGGARINSDSSGALTLSGGVVTSLFNNVTFGGAGNTTVSTAAISGAGGLVKDGLGTTILSATNTYSGATTVSNGILAINGTGSINNSSVTINGGNFRYNSSTAYSGALTLTSGTISGTNWNGSLGNQTIATGDIVSPGNSPGTATTTGQTWAAGGTYEWEINSTAGSAGLDPGWDLISGTGTLDITATVDSKFTIDVLSLTTGNAAGTVFDFDETLSYNWMIANFDTINGFSEDAFIIDTTQFAVHNTFTGTFDIALGNTGSIGGTSNQIWLTYTAIPEPKAVLLGCLGVLLLLRRRR